VLASYVDPVTNRFDTVLTVSFVSDDREENPGKKRSEHSRFVLSLYRRGGFMMRLRCGELREAKEIVHGWCILCSLWVARIMTTDNLLGRQVNVLDWAELRDVLPFDPSGTITQVSDTGDGVVELTVRICGLAKNYIFELNDVEVLPHSIQGLNHKRQDSSH